jgi:uncharacterized protein YjbJ (UPF0337 family)
MNRDAIEGKWKQYRGKMKAQWDRLTGHRLDVIDGNRVEVTGNIQEGYGITRDAAEQQIKRFKDRKDD